MLPRRAAATTNNRSGEQAARVRPRKQVLRTAVSHERDAGASSAPRCRLALSGLDARLPLGLLVPLVLALRERLQLSSWAASSVLAPLCELGASLVLVVLVVVLLRLCTTPLAASTSSMT